MEDFYIDLFAGPGLSRIRDTDEVLDASPLLAARSRYPFEKLYFCDKDKRCIESIKARISDITQPSQREYYIGDANEKAREIIADIPSRDALSLAFLDPTGLHLHYETLRVLGSRKTDLIVFFPDSIDAARNWELYYFDNPSSNLDLVLGPGVDWRTRVPRASKPGQELRKIYQEQIKKLGYEHQAIRRIQGRGTPLYVLIFCSKNKAGLKIWENIALKDQGGQRELKFD